MTTHLWSTLFDLLDLMQVTLITLIQVTPLSTPLREIEIKKA